MLLRALSLGYDNEALGYDKKAIYVDLGDISHSKGDISRSIEWYKKALELDPHDYTILFKLGCRFMDVRAFNEAENTFLKAVEMKPFCNSAYNMLAILYSQTGRDPEARTMFTKIDELDLLYETAGYYRKGDKARAQETIEKLKASGSAGVDHDKQCQRLVEHMATFNRCIGGVKEYYQDVEMHRQNEYGPMTQASYEKLRQLAQTGKFDIVCMQYPGRSLEPLERMVGEGEGIYFLSNEENFKKALETERYDRIFTDCFGGDFGHCTDEGNRLIAENLAQLIEREIIPQIR